MTAPTPERTAELRGEVALSDPSGWFVVVSGGDSPRTFKLQVGELAWLLSAGARLVEAKALLDDDDVNAEAWAQLPVGDGFDHLSWRRGFAAGVKWLADQLSPPPPAGKDGAQ